MKQTNSWWDPSCIYSGWEIGWTNLRGRISVVGCTLMAMGLHLWASVLACHASRAHLWRYVVGMALHDLCHLPLSGVHLTCCVFCHCWLCDIPWRQGYFRVQCPFCLPNVLLWATATQNPVYYTCLEWVYRSCLPEWARCGPLLPCGPVGGVIKNEDTGPYRSSYKTLVLRGIHRCDT